MLDIQRVNQKNDREISRFVAIWESAVTATHQFLSPWDILEIKPEVEKALKEIRQLYCCCDGDTAMGFVGVEKDKVEMLFVDAAVRGRGVGKKLLQYAVNELGARYVNVNEQNEMGVGFYDHMGFHTESRSETDEQGRPFPILHLIFSEAAEL